MSECTYRFSPEGRETTIDEPWECPHERYEGADKCVFHLSASERAEHGVDGETLERELRAVVSTRGRREKELIDADFGDLDLSYAVLEAPDNYPIDLRHATVSGDIDLSDATVHQPLDLRHAELNRVELTDAKFTGQLRMNQSTFDGPIDGEGVVFADDVDSRNTGFTSAVVLDEARFHGDACFKRTAFEAPALFRGAEFRGDANLLDDDACFEDAVFAADAAFTEAEFRYADFVNVTFEGAVEFEEATFDGDAEFRGATFEGRAGFRGAEFHGDANVRVDDATFADARFEGDAVFDGATFRMAVFESATFEERAAFSDTRFDGETTFADAAVSGDAEFDEARFYHDTNFAETVFEGDVSFPGVEFHGGDNVEDDDLTFEDATVEGALLFEQSRFQYANFAGMTVAGPADFSESVFELEADFSATNWSDEVAFLEVRFRDDADFEGVAFADDAEFRGTEFQGGANTEADDLDMAAVTFAGVADFEAAEFRYATFRNTEFRGEANFTETWFDDDARFEGCTFERVAVFDEARFTDDANFDNATVRDDAAFRGAEFRGGANMLDDDATFTDTAFERDVTFEQAQFGYANFAKMSVGGDAVFRAATFDDEATFKHLLVEGETHFDRATFADDATFAEVEFGGETRFDQCRFGSNVDFSATRFEGETQFSGTAFEGSATVLSDDADFREAVFRERVDFDKAEFKYSNFGETTFEGDASFEWTVFEEGAAYTEATVHGSFEMCHAQFGGNATVDSVVFHGDATFEGTEFTGGDTQSQGVVFDNSEFRAEATFVHTEFTTASFDETRFHVEPRFESARFRGSMYLRIAPAGKAIKVNLSHAELDGGRIVQPDDGGTFYDLTAATVREVRFEATDSEFELLDYFLFRETDFDGFDFSEHLDLLSRNDWNIHGFRYHEVADDGEEVPLDPATLERTYLMAKNSAYEFGHRKAGSEFYIKEFTYRRKKNGGVLRDQSVDLRSRLTAGGKWFSNWLLYQTCGYGERLWRIVYISGLVVVTWALLYATVTEGTRGPGNVSTEGLNSVAELVSPEGLETIGRTLYFSLVTFTTLGYGDVQPVGPVARTLASLESFIGALLVALVVFVIGRRMA